MCCTKNPLWISIANGLTPSDLHMGKIQWNTDDQTKFGSKNPNIFKVSTPLHLITSLSSHITCHSHHSRLTSHTTHISYQVSFTSLTSHITHHSHHLWSECRFWWRSIWWCWSVTSGGPPSVWWCWTITFGGRRNIWWCRSVAGVAFGDARMAFVMAGATCGDIGMSLFLTNPTFCNVAVPLFVAGARLGQCWNVSSRGTRNIWCMFLIQNDQVRDGHVMFGSCSTMQMTLQPGQAQYMATLENDNVNHISYVTRINHESHFSWQAQHVVILERHFSWSHNIWWCWNVTVWWKAAHWVMLECHFTWQAKHLVMSECRCSVQCKDVSCVTRSWEWESFLVAGTICWGVTFGGTPSIWWCWTVTFGGKPTVWGLEKSCLAASAALGTRMETQRYRGEPLG